MLPAINSAISTPGVRHFVGAAEISVLRLRRRRRRKQYAAASNRRSGTRRCQSPINPALCTTIKDRGIKIAVLYTTYLALPTNDWYKSWIAPFNAGPYGPSPNSEIAINMKACASPGFYFEVSPTEGISDAMNTLFQKAVTDARIAS